MWMKILKEDNKYLSFESDKSLLIYEEVLPDVYKAKDTENNVGYVLEENIEFYKGFLLLISI